MTKITFIKKGDKYTGFFAEGHSGYGVAGEDIVCASISVLIINTVNSIDVINHEKVELVTNEDEGVIIFNLLSDNEPSTQVLFQSLNLGLTSIQSEYGNDFIQVITKEVNDNVTA